MLASLVLTILITSSALVANQSAEAGLKQILSLVEQGKLAEAESRLRERVKAGTEPAVTYRLLGLLYQRQEKQPQAEEALERASALAGDRDPQTLFLLAQTKFALKKQQEALDLTSKLTLLAGRDPQAHYAVGRLLRENSLPERAVQELQEAHALAPAHPLITAELIVAHLESKTSEQAEELLRTFLAAATFDELMQAGTRFGDLEQFGAAALAFERATNLRAHFYDAGFNLAFALYRNREFARALRVLDQISSAEVEAHSDYHYLRGKVELALQHMQAAAGEYQRALAIQPDNESLCVEVGLLFFSHENLAKALEVLAPCARRLPDSPAIGTALALTYLRVGKYEDAMQSFQRVLALNPAADAAREGLAFLLSVSGKPAEARQVLEQRMGAAGADFYIYYLHALALQRIDPRATRTTALSSLDEAIKRNPRFAPAYSLRGKLRADLGEAEKGIDDLKTATQLDSSYAQPYAYLAQIYFKLGRRGEAGEAQKRSTALNKEREEKGQQNEVENRLLQSLQ